MKTVFALVLLLCLSPLPAQESSEPEQPAGPPAPVTDQVVPVAEEQAPVAEEAEPLAEEPQGESDASDTGVEDFSTPELDLTPKDMEPAEELLHQYERYVQLMEDEVFDEADSVAKRVVELVIEVKGPNSTDFAKALTNLANVQHRTGQYQIAEQNFESAIEILEANQDRLDEALVNPLRGLGASQLEGGRPDKAEETFGRAVHITHVNEGPHNLEQVSILESLSEAYLRMGALEEAKHTQDVIYALNERAYAANTIEMVPSLMRRAEWQHRAGFINDQRTTLRRAIRIIEDVHGKDDVRLVEPLTQLGLSYFYLDLSGTRSYANTSMSTGEVHFKRALRIASENPKASWKLIADTSLALGDYYMYLGNELRADKIYKATWKDLSRTAERRAYRAETLEQPDLLREGSIPEYLNPPSGAPAAGQDVPYAVGTVTVAYDISASGRAANVEVIETQPQAFPQMQRLVQRELRARIYRPRYAEGQPVPTPEQILVHKYFYLPSELEAVSDQDDLEFEDP